MRLLLTIAALLAVPMSSLAQGGANAKQIEVLNFPDPQNVVGIVEVTNLPAIQDVSIVNPPSVCWSSRFQLVGFTTAMYTGEMGGHFGVTRRCQIEFPDSRMCSLEEIAITTRVPDGLAGSAWVHVSESSYNSVLISAEVLPNERSNCSAWRTAVGSISGAAVTAEGVLDGYQFCETAAPIACCAPVP